MASETSKSGAGGASPAPPPAGRGWGAVVTLALRGWGRIRTQLQISERQQLFALTVVIGGLCGLAAVGFHLLINVITGLTIDRALAAPGHAWVAWTLIVPVAGGLVSGVLLQYVVPAARGSGIPQVKVAYAGRSGPLRLRDSVGKFLVGALQIGTGSSLGREGPTVQIAAGLATRVGRLVGVSPQNLRRLLPVGAAAGIAAAFNAPIAAVTFTIEEVVGTLDQTVLSGVIVAAALAAIVERSVLGAHPIFSTPHAYGLDHVSSLALYALLGLVSAALSIAFTDSLLKLRGAFRGLRALPGWAHPAVGGLVTGGLAIVGLAGFGTLGVTGGGYATLDVALAGKLGVGALVGLSLLKLAATVFSYSSGGAGGIFAPSLFIGGMAGGAVGALDVALFHHSADSLGAFALVGMGAVFAGIIRAPITSVLIIVEMTAGYSLILPLMISSMLAYGIARHYRPTPIYEALLEQDGIRLHGRAAVPGTGIPIDEAAIDRRPRLAFAAGTPVTEILAVFPRDGEQEVFAVLDGERLTGILTLEDIMPLVGRTASEVGALEEVMRPPVSVQVGGDVRAAFEALLEQGVRELPATDAGGRVVGFVSERTLFRAFLAGR